MDTKRVISALTSAIDLAEKTGSVLVKTTPDVAKAAVEMLTGLVRCKDCIFFNSGDGNCMMHDMKTASNNYCSWGCVFN